MSFASSFRPSTLLAAAFSMLAAFGAEAATGPLAVATGSYKFTARNEPLVATDRKVDLWAEVYRPAELGARPAPLLVFLHGNHGTCGRFDAGQGVRVDDRTDYTDTGKCPNGYEVTPNHLGYGYLAEELASWGYVVVSINANRGVTAGSPASGDSGLNLMRGRLILRHLALLSAWSRGEGDLAPPASLGFDPRGSLDFSQVGLMGHSRGGEGARAALQQFRDAGSPFPERIGKLKIRSIFEIGPVDGQTSRELDADGVNSIILLPSCDGDVSDLQGMHVFDRVFDAKPNADKRDAFHGTIAVWGANHNAYNTEWLTSDAGSCSGTRMLYPQAGRSQEQQATALGTLVPFFRGTVGRDADATRAALFDPNATLPEALTSVTAYDRGYLPGPIDRQTQVLERFSQPTGTGDSGLPTESAGVLVTHDRASSEHDRSVRIAKVSWNALSPAERYFQVNLSNAGLDLSAFKTFAFRVSLRCFGQICRERTTKSQMDFTVALVTEGGALSRAISVADRVRLGRPVGPARFGELHYALYTAQFPLKAFGLRDRSKVTGVRFIFEKKPEGRLNISDLTVSTIPAAARNAAGDDASQPLVMAAGDTPRPTTTPGADGNRIAIVRGAAGGAPASAAADEMVSVVLTSRRAFPVTGALPTLMVGSSALSGGDRSADGRTMTFTVPASELAGLDGEVSLDLLASAPVWKFGPLPK